MLQVMNHSHILKKHQNHLTFTRFHGDLCALHFELSEPPNALVGTCYSDASAGSHGIHRQPRLFHGAWWTIWVWVNTYENTIFRGLFTSIYQLFTSYFDVNYRGTIGFDTLPYHHDSPCSSAEPWLFLGCPGQQFSYPNLFNWLSSSHMDCRTSKLACLASTQSQESWCILCCRFQFHFSKFPSCVGWIWHFSPRCKDFLSWQTYPLTTPGLEMDEWII